jgi:hypothetical protein
MFFELQNHVNCLDCDFFDVVWTVILWIFMMLSVL